MNNNNIIIISQPIRSGKTTALMNRMNCVTGIDGILSPDVAGIRKLLLIGNKTLIDFETSNQQNVTSVGKFHFSNKAIAATNEYLININLKSNTEIIIDEIGKLELKEQGFYKALIHHLHLIRNSDCHHKLILVVRDSLLDEVKNKFNLNDASVISIMDFITAETNNKQLTLNGLVLCAGNSTRMKTDKAFLQYHQQEQYKYLANLFKALNIPVIISCNDIQEKLIDNDYVKLVDDVEYKNNGPISGLLTAFKNYPEHAFILVGCDYPLLQLHHIETLLSLSQYGFDAVCYVKSTNVSLNEPLITFYNNSFQHKLKQSFHSGNSSIKRILDEANTLKIIAEDDRFLRSFDTPEDFDTFQS